VKVASLQRTRGGEPSELVRARVIAARDLAKDRFFKKETSTPQNAVLSLRDLERVAALDERGSSALALAVASLGLSARAYTKVLRVARTIADLAGNTAVSASHIAEAIGTRVLDRATSQSGMLAAS
jgi:magnesium chelatase family protein